MNAMKSHADIEVRNAREIYLRHARESLQDIVRAYDANACSNYKGTYMYAFVRTTRPATVVETGVAGGVSTYSILQGLEDIGTGKLYSIDLPNATEQIPGGQTPGFLVPERLRRRWDLRLGDSRELLPQLLKSLGSVDMFCHDSLHTYEHMTYEFETAWLHLRINGMLFSDDIQSCSAFQDFCASKGIEWTGATRREPQGEIGIGWTYKS